ncbi:hypothetical protein INF37_09625 [Pseudoflavonifractor sp. DSM 107456]|uniref:Uncharacterized protein n=1 Tax=Pseudoflavonifractor gallinarum TaxID=2779352 RepID=A0ABR9RC39_9FIRM|nr:hypothetical protein [Pseudoflavonifractor gallinarum]MBE5056256.1 hypothetical protein [Pseudoflavonifractor gallinarum]
MKQYWKLDEEYGVPSSMEECDELFLPAQKARAEQIMQALTGLHVCTALALLKKCEQAVLQSTVDGD